MSDLKTEILINTNQGFDIFKAFIPELQKNGPSKNFRAVFREDGNNADANIFYNDKARIWCYKDFVTGETLNPFDFVMKLRNVEFVEALKIIQDIAQVSMPKHAARKTGIIDFNMENGGTFDYWYRYAEKQAILSTLDKYQVKSLISYTFNKNNKKITIRAAKDDPIFAFQISKTCYKIYRPNAKGNQPKHMWLGKKPAGYQDVFGLEQLPDFRECILIVEGLKDVIVANANHIPAVGVDHASTVIKNEAIETLKKRCKYPILCYDIDEAGIKASDKTAGDTGLIKIQLPEDIKEQAGKIYQTFFSKSGILSRFIPSLRKQQNSKTINQWIDRMRKAKNQANSPNWRRWKP